MKRMRVGNTITVGNVKLIPVETVSMRGNNSKNGFFVYVKREPIGVVIVSPLGRSAIDINGKLVPLETYLQHINGLREMLSSL
jgi:hypothetical protein